VNCDLKNTFGNYINMYGDLAVSKFFDALQEDKKHLKLLKSKLKDLK
jgi:hypothetical protein